MGNAMRLQMAQKLALAVRIRDAAVSAVRDRGVEGVLRGKTHGRYLLAQIGEIDVFHSILAATSNEKTDPNILDLRLKGKGKVFSVRWDPFDVVRFDYGPWMDALLGETVFHEGRE